MAAGGGSLRHAGRVEHRFERAAIVDLAQSDRGRGALQSGDCVGGTVCIGQPDLGNVVLSQSEAVMGVVVNCRQKISDDAGRWRAVVAGMARNGEEAVGVDGRLAVFGGDNDSGGFEKTSAFERSDHLPDRCVHELYLSEHFGPGRTLGILITASVCVRSNRGFGFNQLLSNADRLEVHAEDRWDGSVACGKVSPAVDLVEYSIDLQLVVAFDGVEIRGPIIAIGNQLTAVKTGFGSEGCRLNSG